MRTTKPFSTISYNSALFLKIKLDDLIAKRIISFYAFVEHFPEEDEKKKHKHLIIIPNGQIDTNQIDDLLQELDPNNPLKPLKCMPFKSSKWDDWYLYTTHDTSYLASKAQSRKYHYTVDNYISSDEDYLNELIHTIDRSKYAKTQDFVSKVLEGASFLDMVKKGQIPVPQFNQWLSMYDFVKYGQTFRNGKETHTPIEKLEGD